MLEILELPFFLKCDLGCVVFSARQSVNCLRSFSELNYINWLCLTMFIQAMEGVSEPKKNPLIRASSEESSSDPNYCPFPGDTLPWNLPKHHRMKRSKSASGDVLDPAERAVIRIAGMMWYNRLQLCSEHESRTLL